MTLMELMIAVILLSLIALGFSSIAMFSHMQMITTDRRAKAQNEATFVLEHMNKEIPRAIGNIATDGANRVIDTRQIGGDNAVSVFIDMPDTSVGAAANTPNGRRDANDRWIAYRFNELTHSIWYCPQCNAIVGAAILNSDGSAVCASCNPAWGTNDINTLSDHIVAFFPPVITVIDAGPPVQLGNSIDLDITARWNAAQGVSTDNPDVRMQSRIKMPSVSVN